MRSKLLKHYLKLREYGEPVGVRQAQRLLNLNSPGRAQRVLERLVKEGLALKREDKKYEIVKDPPPELIGTIFVAGKIYPRILVYATYSTVLGTAFIILAGPPIYAALLIILLIAPLWMETIIEYRQISRAFSR